MHGKRYSKASIPVDLSTVEEVFTIGDLDLPNGVKVNSRRSVTYRTHYIRTRKK